MNHKAIYQNRKKLFIFLDRKCMYFKDIYEV